MYQRKERAAKGLSSPGKSTKMLKPLNNIDIQDSNLKAKISSRSMIEIKGLVEARDGIKAPKWQQLEGKES